MGEIIRRTQSRYKGPWLFDKESLTALDDIVDEQWAVLESHRKHLIDAKVRKEHDEHNEHQWFRALSDEERSAKYKEMRQRAQERYEDDKRVVILTLKNGNKVRVKAFREAFTDVHCTGQVVVEAELSIACGGVRGSVEMSTDDYPYLHINTFPQSSEQASELFAKLDGWADQRKPDWLRNLRGNVGSGAWFAFALFFFLLGGVNAMMQSYKDEWHEDASKLINDGVTTGTQNHAIELILKKVGGFTTAPSTSYPRWFIAVIIIAFITTAIFSITAKAALEIGSGSSRVKWEKNYDWILRKVIPAFVFFGVASSLAATLISGVDWTK